MAKFSRISKLSQIEKEDLFINFCETLESLKNSREIALFLKDLLGEIELEILTKRLGIAKYLIEGRTYEEINSILKVSHGTISRVNFWLKMSGTGYRLVSKRARKKEKKYSQFGEDIKKIKRTYRQYFWPELLFEGIIKELGRKKKEKLLDALSGLRNKQKIMQEFDECLRETYKKRKNIPQSPD